jgi:hypothetical protein
VNTLTGYLWDIVISMVTLQDFEFVFYKTNVDRIQAYFSNKANVKI